MSKPEVSVIMAVYNNITHFEAAVKSIINQSFRDFEFLILDDGSSESYTSTIKDVQSVDQRIAVYVNDGNKGLATALNKLIHLSSGKYIARMDADDISDPSRLQDQIDYLKRNEEIDVLATKGTYIDDEGNYICDKYVPDSISTIYRAMSYHNYIIHPSVMIKKSTFMQHGVYNEKFRRAQDWELWNRYIKSGVEFQILNTPLIRYRIPKKDNNNKYKTRLCLLNKSTKLAMGYINKLSLFKRLYYYLQILIPYSFFLFTIRIYQNYYANSYLNTIKKQA
jgi:glycosyltransferase EpsE